MVLQCALAACTLHHRDAFASVMKFIKDLVHCPSDAEQVCSLNLSVFFFHLGFFIILGNRGASVEIACGTVHFGAEWTVADER